MKQSRSHYKYCIVPMCKNTTASAPDKLYFSVPRHAELRHKWCQMMRRDDKKNPKLSYKSNLYCCEDHFNLQEDTKKKTQYKANIIRLKKGIVPHIFDCQKQAKQEIRREAEESRGVKKKRVKLMQEKSQKIKKEPEEPFVETCNTCKEPLSGVLYVCLQCDYRSCGGCDADGAHQHHYVMRAPATRTQEELEKVLEKVREVLQQVPAQAPPEQCVPEVARTDEDEEEEPYEPSVMIKTEIEIEEQDPFAPENMHDVVIKTEEEDPPEVVPSHSGTSHQRPKEAPANDPNKHVPFTYTDTQIELEEITVKIESPDASDASEASGPPALYLSSQQADQPGKRTLDASPEGDSTPEEESMPKKKGRMKKKTV